MKKLLTLALIAGAFAFTACNNSTTEEGDMTNVEMTDSSNTMGDMNTMENNTMMTDSPAMNNMENGTMMTDTVHKM